MPHASARPVRPPPSAEIERRLAVARAAYEAGRAPEARGLVAAVLADDPRSARAHHLSALCLIDLREFEGAERALRSALALERRDPALHVLMGDLITRPGRLAEAERCYRAALALDRRFLPAALALARLLAALGRHEEALQVTTPLVAGARPTGEAMAAHAELLKQLGRMDEALDWNRRAVGAGAPQAQLEVSATLRELGRYEASEAEARRAFALLGEVPATFIMHGRALQSLGRSAEAEAAYREALRREPLHDAAHEHLGDLLRGRRGEPEAPFERLDAALARAPSPKLAAAKANLLMRAERWEAAFALLADAARRWPASASLCASAARAALHDHGDDAERVEIALAHAERAHAIAPDVPKITALLAEVSLAAGHPERTAGLAAGLLRHWPNNQSVIALQALAWRIMGDERYRELHDYGRVVSSSVIDTPDGWPSLRAYLADLAVALQKFHAVELDTFGLSRQDGVETRQNITPADGAAVRAFFAALEDPIREHLARLGKGRDLLRRRNAGGYRIKAAWSVKTEPEGFHCNHLHPEGWLSSAFYVELPKAVEQGRQGWLKFGEPGVPTRPRLAAEHHVKPDPGRFVLFPSYMWHGTLPYSGEGVRLIMSVDVAPAPR
jgi:tetratricopeptide (TPR) repeat protein